MHDGAADGGRDHGRRHAGVAGGVVADQHSVLAIHELLERFVLGQQPDSRGIALLQADRTSSLVPK